MTYLDDDYTYSELEPLTKQDVQRTVIETLQALQSAAVVVAQRAEAARQRAERENPGFQQRYADPAICRRFIEEKKEIARMILDAESGQGTPEDLDESYRIFAETTSKYEAQPSTRGSVNSSPGLSLQAINSLPLEQRRLAIESLGNRIADVSLDEADPENRRFKNERGE